MAGLLPELTPENRAFWTGGADGQLMIARCGDCDWRIHPPQLVCPACLSEAVEAQPASGCGTIESWTINHQPWMPGLEVPYALAIVSLDDQPGVRITAQLRDVALDAIQIGMAVKVGFEPREDVHIPVFLPA
ncbi:DNA-binding protein [Sphingomonas lacunae]|uniref:DNA-binding protein n=1 Tax=Sphingomonas lacunae TaxID=2698828 RepID=A0A6M4AQX1_9SPHN|nr:OB-fold domain-containing protein [Sphingomonas lacunae]QJQ31438.1 DNA-binding protein [Sphingomonas lacunae]